VIESGEQESAGTTLTTGSSEMTILGQFRPRSGRCKIKCVNPFKRERAIEIETVSATVRVTVTPRPAWIALLVEVVGIVVFGVYIVRAWASMPLWYRALLMWAVASAVIAWFYQLSGSEIIEFDAQKISICEQFLGWTRTLEYPVNHCRELEWREARSQGDNNGLQCKAGWRTIKFGKYISEDEAIEILTVLQTNLPDVAQQLCAVPDRSKKHFTTLNLS
jgi:hypothetical protein